MLSQEVVENIRNSVLDDIDLSQDLTDDDLKEIIRSSICRVGSKDYISLNDRRHLEKRIFHSLRKLDVLEELLADDSITEIMINGYDHIFIERSGSVSRCEMAFSSAEKLDDVIQKIAAMNNRIVNATSPILDAKLEDGSRINIVLPPVALDGSIVSIRKFPQKIYQMEDLYNFGALSHEIIEVVKTLVKAKYNIFVSGGTGSGKTTFLNAMAEFIPKDERIITIEDSAELKLFGVPNLVRLEAKNANIEGKNAISIRDLVKASLRMRPDRIIIGECRGVEAIEILQACNTGHDGSFSTGHANSARDMLLRLETMALGAAEIPLSALRSQIASGIDIIIHLGRMRDKSRKLLEICETDGMVDGEVSLRTIFKFEEEASTDVVRGKWVLKQKLKHRDKLEQAGIKNVEF